MSDIEQKLFSRPIELKALNDDGTFSGYAATFDLDLGGDIIATTAFDDWMRREGEDAQSMSVLWQHSMDKPIGVTTLMQVDAKGLYVEGKLTLGVQRADEARLLSKAGALKGLSIGFYVKEREFKDDVRIIKALDIIEYSFVTRPMNPKAKLTGVKSYDQTLVAMLQNCDSIRSLERTLRDEVGASNSEAKQLVSHLKGLCEAERSEKQLLSEIEATFRQSLEGHK